jgi:hypothetical protein
LIEFLNGLQAGWVAGVLAGYLSGWALGLRIERDARQ